MRLTPKSEDRLAERDKRADALRNGNTRDKRISVGFVAISYDVSQKHLCITGLNSRDVTPEKLPITL